MEYFNFSHLPLLVKEMIADEIVHNSIPEDRIQFATTCKAFNQLVKGAKPKNIIQHLRIHCHKFDMSVFINSENMRNVTLTELKKILQQCQVLDLLLCATDRFTDECFNSKLMDLLLGPCTFVTALKIWCSNRKFKYVDFYKKLSHLKFFLIYDPTRMIFDLPYFPPKLVLKSKYSLSMLAEKTLNHPLSFLKITNDVKLTEIQQFLMAANLEIGAQIRFYFKNHFGTFKVFLKFIGNGLFEFQMLHSFRHLILEQELNSQNKKVLKLSADLCLSSDGKIPFIVTSVSNPDLVVYSGELTTKSREIVFENVAENHFVRILFPRRRHSTYYSPQLLDDWFPRSENCNPVERVKTINKTLGTNIVVIKPEMLEEKFILDQYLPNRTTNAVQISPKISKLLESS